MVMLLRHLLSIAILPFTVTVLVPYWIAEKYGVAPEVARFAGPFLIQLAGLVLLALGLFLAASSVRRFATEGKGTLAPWDPPPRFVVHGPYQYVRNPMISGVIMVLFGEACALRSTHHACWAAFFVALNMLFIPLVEEPQLERRFGEPYRKYCRHVRRFIPRTTPWRANP